MTIGSRWERGEDVRLALKIGLVDVGVGNIGSICRCLLALNATPVLASKPSDIFEADKLILPGVGHFERAVARLKAIDLADPLNEVVLVRKRPILGICLGMQLMASESEEGNTKGFGWIDTNVVRFRVQDPIRNKVPHIGWNTIDIKQRSHLLEGANQESEYYFAHSYHLDKISGVCTGVTRYDYEFPSVIENGNIFGTQFHPEKSREAGIIVIENFLKA